MAKKILGRCYICHAEITRHDIAPVNVNAKPTACYYADWPGDGFACLTHQGVHMLWLTELSKVELPVHADKKA